MKEYVGLWVDSSSAVLVFLRDGEYRVQRIESGVEGHFRLSGGSRSKKTPYGPQDIVSDTRVEKRRKHQYQRYFREVVRALRGTHGILLLGPGETKVHLANAIRRERELAAGLRDVAAADKMTERQLLARVKEFFHPAIRKRKTV